MNLGPLPMGYIEIICDSSYHFLYLQQRFAVLRSSHGWRTGQCHSQQLHSSAFCGNSRLEGSAAAANIWSIQWAFCATCYEVMHFIEIQNNILSKAILITDIFCDTDNILQIYKTWRWWKQRWKAACIGHTRTVAVCKFSLYLAWGCTAVEEALLTQVWLQEDTSYLLQWKLAYLDPNVSDIFQRFHSTIQHWFR